MQVAMILLVCTRIRRIERKIQALLARFQAGTLVVRSGSGTRRPSAAKGLPRSPTAQLPRSFGWLIVQVPYQAAGYGSQLRAVLGDPEMVGLLRASPQARRVLAPLCRMLMIEPEVLTPVEVVAPEVVAKASPEDSPEAPPMVRKEGEAHRPLEPDRSRSFWTKS